MLRGKTALITGSSRGIGKAIAQQFSNQGCFVGINYVNHKKEAESTLESLKNGTTSGMLLQGDISNIDEVKNIVKKLVEQRRRIDILVHNAGIYKRHQFQEISLKDWSKILNVNLYSTYMLTQEALPYIPKNGRIIFLSSQLAFKGTNHGADYATSKAAILGLMRSLSLELATDNILVNAVAPGTIDTDIIANYSRDQRQKRIKEIPLHRLGKPKEIADVCVFLASDLARYITGETINVNGGLYIH